MDTSNPAPESNPRCPRCGGTHVVRNGTLRSGSPQWLCRGCGRRFVAEPKKGPVTEERKALIRRLLLERLALRAIARAAGVSRSWLQGFVNELYREETPWEPAPAPKKGRAS
jgi:insertion element IS1 protein InsB